MISQLDDPLLVTTPFGEAGPEAEFQDALSSLEGALASGVRAFAEWFAKNWTMTPEEWLKTYDRPPPESDWFEGYNAGVKSITMACDQFLDQYCSR